jgi:hypothetical protein
MTWKKVKLKLSVDYPDDYPDALPKLELEAVDGELDESESDTLLQSLADVVRLVLCKVDRGPEDDTGRREHRHGDDFYTGFASPRTAVKSGGETSTDTHGGGARKGAPSN